MTAEPIPFPSDWTPIRPEFHPAVREWAEISRYELISVAERGETITYKILFDLVEDQVTITRQPMMWRKWITYVLAEVAVLNTRYEEPLLTCLVVDKQKQEVNEGYSWAVQIRYGENPVRPLIHASIERRKCYRLWKG